MYGNSKLLDTACWAGIYAGKRHSRVCVYTFIAHLVLFCSVSFVLEMLFVPVMLP